MCFSTSISLLCSSPTCPTPSDPYHTLTSLTKCSLHGYIGRHMPWPGGCSACASLHQTENISPTHTTTPVDHFVTPEPPLRWRRGFCPTCQPADTPSPPPTSFTWDDRSRLYASHLNLVAQGIPIITAAIATATLPLMSATGQSPHVHCVASLYAAAHLAAVPVALGVVLRRFPDVSVAMFRHAYGKIWASRDAIFRARIVKYGEEWEKLPKPCCDGPQGKACARTKTDWGTRVDVCAGVQIGGDDKDVWPRWVRMWRLLGMDIEAETVEPPCPEKFVEWNAERKLGFPNGITEDHVHR